MPKKRNSNIELLRIVSMLLIVVGHCMGSRFEGMNQPIIIFLSNVVFGSWAILGVDLFVIISAWFLVDQKFRFTRIISVLFEAICYIVAYGIVYAIIIGVQTGSVLTGVKSIAFFFANGLFKQYHWFVAAYLLMCFAAPFLSKAIRELSKKALKTVIVIFAIAVICHNFTGAGYYSLLADSSNFLFIFLVVGYIKKYGVSVKRPLFIASVIIIAIITGKIVLRFTGYDGVWYYASKIIEVSVANTNRYSLLLVLLAICVFLWTNSIKPKNNRFICTVAGATFGVYLFHETFIPINYSYIDAATLETVNQSQVSLKNLVVGWFCDIGFISTGALFPLELLSVAVIVFLCGIIIELMRNKLIQVPFMKMINKKFCNGIKRIDDLFMI